MLGKIPDHGQLQFLHLCRAVRRFLRHDAGLSTAPGTAKMLSMVAIIITIARNVSFWENRQKVFLDTRILSSKTVTE